MEDVDTEPELKRAKLEIRSPEKASYGGLDWVIVLMNELSPEINGETL